MMTVQRTKCNFGIFSRKVVDWRLIFEEELLVEVEADFVVSAGETKNALESNI